MLVTGEFIDAHVALECGLVNRVAAAGELDEAVRALVVSIVAKSRVAVAAGKELFYRQIEMGIKEAYALAAETMVCNMMDEGTLEGTLAFVQ